MRTVLHTLFLLIIIAFGVAAGLLFRGWLNGADVPENLTGAYQESGPEAGAPTKLPGWCCIDYGSACTESPDPVTCLRQGELFNVDRSVCDRICTAPAP